MAMDRGSEDYIIELMETVEPALTASQILRKLTLLNTSRGEPTLVSEEEVQQLMDRVLEAWSKLPKY